MQVGLETGAKPDNLSLVYLFTGVLLLAFIVFKLENKRCRWFLTREALSLDTEADFTACVYCLCVLTERLHDSFSRNLLQTALRELALNKGFLRDDALLDQQISKFALNQGRKAVINSEQPRGCQSAALQGD